MCNDFVALAGSVFNPAENNEDPETGAEASRRRSHDEMFSLFSKEYNRIKRHKTQRDSVSGGDGTDAAAVAIRSAADGV